MTESGSPTPRVSVITVVRNDVSGLARTLASMAAQNYDNFQFVAVDGGSSDGTVELIRQQSALIDAWISEPDEGIYHAMNKGVGLADGEWLLFMNAGDEFSGNDALSAAAASIREEVDVVYSDWIYREDNELARASFEKMNVRHQSVLYRKNLHDIFGLYVVGKGVTISDFIFFLSLSERYWEYCENPISRCDKTGVSSKPSHFYQRMATELIFGRRSKIQAAAIILLYPAYRFLKRGILGKR